MTTLFICTETGCPNKDIEYNMESEITIAECGGCKAILEPIKQA